jgi:hypothetical protein
MARGRRRETRRDVSSLQPPGTLPGYGWELFWFYFFSALFSVRYRVIGLLHGPNHTKLTHTHIEPNSTHTMHSLLLQSSSLSSPASLLSMALPVVTFAPLQGLLGPKQWHPDSAAAEHCNLPMWWHHLEANSTGSTPVARHDSLS